MSKEVRKKQDKEAVTESPLVSQETETSTHVPGQTEAVRQPDQTPCEVPAEGNNIGSVVDRAFADTPDPNTQPPVEKTFVSPKDEPTPDTHQE